MLIGYVGVVGVPLKTYSSRRSSFSPALEQDEMTTTCKSRQGKVFQREDARLGTDAISRAGRVGACNLMIT